MSRPRRRGRPAAGVPEWLAVFRPEDWTDDVGDVLAVGYGRVFWAAARRTWREGGDPRPFAPPVWACN